MIPLVALPRTVRAEPVEARAHACNGLRQACPELGRRAQAERLGVNLAEPDRHAMARITVRAELVEAGGLTCAGLRQAQAERAGMFGVSTQINA